MYSIKAVSQATGLTVETLRAWERRYQAVVPPRDEMGRRVYRAEHVLRLRRLREATERGHPIGRLVHLDEAALKDLLEAPQPAPPTAAASSFVERILDAAQRYAAAEVEQVLTLAIALLPPRQLIDDVLSPLLREVGDRWHSGQFSIAQERLVSAAVRRHVALMVDAYDRSAHGPVIVFATLPGERHELGLLLASMVTASHGCQVHYLGPELPAEEIARYAESTGAAAVAVSVIVGESTAPVADELGRLRRALDPERALWIGGSGARRLTAESLPAGCVIVGGTPELEQRLELLSAG
jgi:DNA-binding transcriptional MerR regulator